MSLKKAKQFLLEKKGYLKKSPKILSERINVEEEICKQAINELNKQYRPKKIRRLFFDIETTPNVVYTWRIGYNINVSHDSIIKERVVLSIHWKWQGSDRVHNLRWDDSHNDKEMLIKFIKIANQADEIIAHNGDRFDMKWLRTRCIFHRIPMFPEYKTLDTLKKAKAHFNFNSNKLDYISQFLGVGAKTEHEGYSLWLKCMDGDEEAMEKMIEYGDNDVVILEDMYNVLMPYIKHNTHHGVHNGGNSSHCPNCGSKPRLKKNITTASGTLQ